MPKGGARARSGPAPDPNALRRDRKGDGEWTVLPAEGRKGRTPAWPLKGQSAREKSLWQAWWKKPQAILWERNQQQYEVAMYVRCWAEAELPNAPTNLRNLVRQQGDALLTTITAMHAARVKLSEDELQPARSARAGTRTAAASKSSAKERLKALDGGA
jgi:hypothetical protein